MKRLSIFASFTAASVLAASAAAQTVSIITTPAGSFSNSAGSAMAKVIGDKTDLRALVQAQASTGFEETVSGTADFNVSNSFDATFFATGTGEYEKRAPAKDLRYVGALIPYRVAMHVRADSPIKSIADLKGKRLSSEFNAQKTIGRIIGAHLANAGLSYDDVQKVPTPNVVRQAQDFTAGKTDVLFFALGSAAVKQANASVGGVRVLEIDTSPAAVQRVQKILPGAYVLQVKPHPSIEGLSKPTSVVAFDMVMVTRAELADDVVYKVTKAIYESKPALQEIFRPFVLFNPKEMAKPLQAVPMHPGAARFYKEVGILK